MTQSTSPRSDLTDTPWQSCPGLRAASIDGAASMIVMEVLIDALSRLPQGRAALDAAVSRRTDRQAGMDIGASPVEIAAGALALALIEAARGLEPVIATAA